MDDANGAPFWKEISFEGGRIYGRFKSSQEIFAREGTEENSRGGEEKQKAESRKRRQNAEKEETEEKDLTQRSRRASTESTEKRKAEAEDRKRNEERPFDYAQDDNDAPKQKAES